MKTLNIAAFPVTGQALIEASAGTGKTFTITALYNRLLLGHNSPLPRLGCDQILVVTFTRAATEELRGRIRERLRLSFEDCLRLAAGSEAQDPAFAALVAELDDAEPEALSRWLQANLAQMDEAAVFTIHGFCQRMLKQFAFDSGVMFDSELVLDADDYLQQACEDIWRQGGYHLTPSQGRYWLNRYAGPDALLARFRNWLSRPQLQFIPAPEHGSFETRWQQLQQQFEAVKQSWQQLGDSAVGDLISASGVDKRSYSARNLPRWLALVSGYLNDGFRLPVVKELEKFCASVLQQKTKKGQAPQQPLFEQIEQFYQAAEALALQLDMQLFEQVRERYFLLLEQASALTPDDLLRLLASALQGPQGQHLAQQIRACYPVAMIDEFQDTDPQQYQIFNAIYPPGESCDGTGQGYGLTMIGDPKQAIYGFRGADIFTYMQARRQLPETRHFTLGTNWRSHSQLIAAVNHVWQCHPNPFVFAADIGFHPVAAAGNNDGGGLRQQQVDQSWQPLQPLQFWLQPEPVSRMQAQQQAAAQCARQIASLIYHDQQRLGERPVAAGDIAVLVRSRRQAGWIRDALSAEQVGSVFLTRDSVYDSQEARDVLAWLNAVQQPADERAVRTALATVTQGLSATELDRLLNDEQAWEQQLEHMVRYQQLWQQRGIMAAIMAWLETPLTDAGDSALAVSLRQHPDGERRLTNLIHLGELLQTAARRIRGSQGLIRWFSERVLDLQRSGDEAQLRLETDANLVTIVTIHKSKGLEYPLVFLPFLWDDSYIPARQTEAQYYQGYDDDRPAAMVLDLAPDDDAKALAVRDIKAEYLRLLYVALTRAKFGCYIWLANARDGRRNKALIEHTALGYLLGLDAEPDWQALQQQLSHEAIAVAPFCASDYPGTAAVCGSAASVVAQSFSGRLWDSWRVTSYSQLTAHSAVHPVHESTTPDWQDPDLQQLDWEVQAAGGLPRPENSTAGLPAAINPALSFPKGANPGTCLHAMLEHWDFRDAAELQRICAEQLTYFSINAGLEDVCQWLQQVVNTPLYVDASEGTQCFTLAQLERSQRLDEMEFHLPLPDTTQPLTAAAVNRLMAGKKLQFDAVSGYLKGFIDLIFCYDGRYYVADYKSNHLGYQAQDYVAESLNQAMEEHHYDIQAWIYTLALDRLLRQRLPDYRPQQHLGGVFYFYLRGMIREFADQPAGSLQQDSADDLFTDSDTGADAERLQQHAGVYYAAVDFDALQRWQQTLLPEVG